MATDRRLSRLFDFGLSRVLDAPTQPAATSKGSPVLFPSLNFVPFTPTSTTTTTHHEYRRHLRPPSNVHYHTLSGSPSLVKSVHFQSPIALLAPRDNPTCRSLLISIPARNRYIQRPSSRRKSAQSLASLHSTIRVHSSHITPTSEHGHT